jgi:hypothetical protein
MRRSGLQERIRIVPGGQTVEEGTAAARLLLDDGPLPTAIVAYDDDCAAGLWEALTRPAYPFLATYLSLDMMTAASRVWRSRASPPSGRMHVDWPASRLTAWLPG